MSLADEASSWFVCVHCKRQEERAWKQELCHFSDNISAAVCKLQEKVSCVLNDSTSENGGKLKMLAQKLVTKCLRKLEEYNIQSSLGVKKTRI